MGISITLDLLFRHDSDGSHSNASILRTLRSQATGAESMNMRSRLSQQVGRHRRGQPSVCASGSPHGPVRRDRPSLERRDPVVSLHCDETDWMTEEMAAVFGLRYGPPHVGGLLLRGHGICIAPDLEEKRRCPVESLRTREDATNGAGQISTQFLTARCLPTIAVADTDFMRIWMSQPYLCNEKMPAT